MDLNLNLKYKISETPGSTYYTTAIYIVFHFKKIFKKPGKS